jgi:hypothetical protein
LRIGTGDRHRRGKLALTTESNMFGDSCLPFATDNDLFFEKLCGGGRVDAGGDGASDEDCSGSDCDDPDADVHPDAVERCDGVADHFDGSIDLDGVHQPDEPTGVGCDGSSGSGSSQLLWIAALAVPAPRSRERS